MLYAQQLLSQGGPLQVIWVAAHMDRSLKRNQVFEASIPTSVDTISAELMNPGTSEAPLALRLSGQLLLGIVRIFSRKVTYLQQDCQEALTHMKQVIKVAAVDLEPQDEQAALEDITLADTQEILAADYGHGLDAGPLQLDVDMTRTFGSKGASESQAFWNSNPYGHADEMFEVPDDTIPFDLDDFEIERLRAAPSQNLDNIVAESSKPLPSAPFFIDPLLASKGDVFAVPPDDLFDDIPLDLELLDKENEPHNDTSAHKHKKQKTAVEEHEHVDEMFEAPLDDVDLPDIPIPSTIPTPIEAAPAQSKQNAHSFEQADGAGPSNRDMLDSPAILTASVEDISQPETQQAAAPRSELDPATPAPARPEEPQPKDKQRANKQHQQQQQQQLTGSLELVKKHPSTSLQCDEKGIDLSNNAIRALLANRAPLLDSTRMKRQLVARSSGGAAAPAPLAAPAPAAKLQRLALDYAPALDAALLLTCLPASLAPQLEQLYRRAYSLLPRHSSYSPMLKTPQHQQHAKRLPPPLPSAAPPAASHDEDAALPSTSEQGAQLDAALMQVDPVVAAPAGPSWSDAKGDKSEGALRAGDRGADTDMEAREHGDELEQPSAAEDESAQRAAAGEDDEAGHVAGDGYDPDQHDKDSEAEELDDGQYEVFHIDGADPEDLSRDPAHDGFTQRTQAVLTRLQQLIKALPKQPHDKDTPPNGKLPHTPSAGTPSSEGGVGVLSSRALVCGGVSSRMEACRTFFELLVLKNRGYVQLEQRRPFTHMAIAPTHKFHNK